MSEARDEEELLDPSEDGGVTEDQRARAMGWRPLNEYRGDHRLWTDAATFIEKGEREHPVLREQNRRMSEKLVRNERKMEGLERTIGEQRDAIAQATALAIRADRQGYERAKAELKGKLRDAVETGDTVVYDQVSEELEALETARAAEALPPPPPPASPPPPPAAAGPPPETLAFIRANPWFNDASRPHLRNTMIEMEKAARAENPDAPLADVLDIALERMERAYPEILDEEDMRSPPPPPARRRAPSALAPTGAREPGRRTTASPIDAIADPTERADARRAYQDVLKWDPDMPESEYMQMYDDPHLDPLELRRKRKK